MSMPFEPGQAPPNCQVPLCVPHVAGNELLYLRECIESGWLSSGPFVDRLSVIGRTFSRSVGESRCVGWL